MRSDLTFDGVRLTAESTAELVAILRWSNHDVEVASAATAPGDYPTLALRFALQPKPFRPDTADGPVPDGWREDCHGWLFTPNGSTVGYERALRHWFVHLSGSLFPQPGPRYFALRSEATARLQELMAPAEKAKPWRAKVGDWVRVKSTGEPAKVAAIRMAQQHGVAGTESVWILDPDGPSKQGVFLGALEPWRPRVGDRVSHDRRGPGVVVAAEQDGEYPFTVRFAHGMDIRTPYDALSPLPGTARPPQDHLVVGAEWRGVYPG